MQPSLNIFGKHILRLSYWVSPKPYFSIEKKLKLTKKKYAATSHVQVIQSNKTNEIYYASWYYIIGKITIKILYYVYEPPMAVHGKMIHP